MHNPKSSTNQQPLQQEIKKPVVDKKTIVEAKKKEIVEGKIIRK